MNALASPLPPVATGTGLFALTEGINGPSFLIFFIIWLIGLRVALTVLRSKGHDYPFTTLACLGLFEGVGVFRIVDGHAHGLHRWGLLVVLMVIGGLLMFLRAEHFNQSGRGDGGSCGSTTSSCSSSSGGGGCGGGGGGCGGCGGGD
jgi:uncharacterized membrane protein YgcG